MAKVSVLERVGRSATEVKRAQAIQRQIQQREAAIQKAQAEQARAQQRAQAQAQTEFRVGAIDPQQRLEKGGKLQRTFRSIASFKTRAEAEAAKSEFDFGPNTAIAIREVQKSEPGLVSLGPSTQVRRSGRGGTDALGRPLPTTAQLRQKQKELGTLSQQIATAASEAERQQLRAQRQEVSSRFQTQPAKVGVVDEGAARRVGTTPSGGTFNVPKSATVSPSFIKRLPPTAVTGRETAADIIKAARAQSIATASLPAGSVIATPTGDVNVSSVQDTTIAPSVSFLGGSASRVVKQQQTLKRAETDPLRDVRFERKGVGVDNLRGDNSFLGRVRQVFSQEAAAARATQLERRKQLFFSSPGFERISQTASLITGGRLRPIEERSFPGRAAETITTGLMTLPQTLYFSAQNIVGTGDVILFGKPTREDVIRGVVTKPAREVGNILNPFTEEGKITYIAAAGGALIPAVSQTAKSRAATQQVQGLTISEVPPETLPSTLLRVRELTGADVNVAGLRTSFRDEAALLSRPKFGRSELIDIRQVKEPDLFLAELEGTRQTGFISQTSGQGQLPVKSNQFFAEIPVTRGPDVITPAQAKQFLTPYFERRGFAGDVMTGVAETRGRGTVRLTPIENIRDLPATVKAARQRKPGPLRIGEVTVGSIGFEPKLPGARNQIIIETPRGIIAGEERITATGQIVRDIRQLPKPKAPEVFFKTSTGKKRAGSQQQPNYLGRSEGAEVASGTGQVSLLVPPRLQRVTQARTQTRTQARTKQTSQQMSRTQAMQRLSELLGRSTKKRTGIFVIEEVVPARGSIVKASLRTPYFARTQLVTGQAGITAVNFIQGTALSSQQAQAQSQLQSQAQQSQQVQGLQLLSAQSTLTSQATSTQQAQAQRQAQQLDLLQRTQQVTRPRPPRRPRTPRRPRRPRPPRVPKLLLGGESVEPPETSVLFGNSKQAFDVQVRKGERRGDKFVTVARGLPRNRALRRGAEIVDSFIESSFRLKARGRTRQSDTGPVDLSTKYRMPRKGSKLPRDTFVEKKSFRLDSPGEVNQISFFKQRAKAKRTARKRARRKFSGGAGRYL